MINRDRGSGEIAGCGEGYSGLASLQAARRALWVVVSLLAVLLVVTSLAAGRVLVLRRRLLHAGAFPAAAEKQQASGMREGSA